MGMKMVQSWVDFAVTGDPTPPGSLLPTWSPVTVDNHKYLKIDSESGMEISQDYLDRVNYWQTIMDKRPLP